MSYHAKGIRFALKNPPFLFLSIIPFVITLALYAVGFYIFTLHADSLLNMIWSVDTSQSSRYVEWLYWAYVHVVKFFLYVVLLVIMFYTFIVFSNVLASPIYDYICTRYAKLYHNRSREAEGGSFAKTVLKSMAEEGKKAVFLLFVPLFLILIPVVGALLGFIVAATFMGWDYVDFSLSKDCPLIKDRVKMVWRYKFYFCGFGCPLVVPFLGLIFMPFAILGSTKLYFEKMEQTRGIDSLSKTTTSSL